MFFPLGVIWACWMCGLVSFNNSGKFRSLPFWRQSLTFFLLSHSTSRCFRLTSVSLWFWLCWLSISSNFPLIPLMFCVLWFFFLIPWFWNFIWVIQAREDRHRLPGAWRLQSTLPWVLHGLPGPHGLRPQNHVKQCMQELVENSERCFCPIHGQSWGWNFLITSSGEGGVISAMVSTVSQGLCCEGVFNLLQVLSTCHPCWSHAFLLCSASEYFSLSPY